MTALSFRRPVWVLHVFVVGLALHNLIAALLWRVGVRGVALDVISAWKELLLALAALGLLQAGAFRRRLDAIDLLALAYAGFVIVYAVTPQGVLDGGATAKGVFYALRHDLVPFGAYVVGRGLALNRTELRSLGKTIVVTAAGVASFGLVDVFFVPLSWWRSSGAAGWFTEQLGFSYQGLSGLPENFIYNTGDEQPIRRLTSTLLSPLAASYVLGAALLALAAATLMRPTAQGKARVLLLVVVGVLVSGVLWSHSRSTELALVAALLLLAWVRRDAGRRAAVVALAALALLAISTVFAHEYAHLGPRTSFTSAELDCQRAHAHGLPCTADHEVITKAASVASTGTQATSGFESDASTSSHWASLRGGIETIVHHPQGYGLGNAGSTAARTGVRIEAGESSFTELGVETGLLGGLVFAAWCFVLLARTLRALPWVGALFGMVVLLGLQTDVIGVPWLGYVVWALAGSSAALVARQTSERLP